MNPIQFSRFDLEKNTKYFGAIRVPNVQASDNAGSGLVYDRENDSLFITSKIAEAVTLKGQRTAEITIPELVISDKVDELKRAEFLQEFTEPTEGAVAKIREQVPGTPVYISDYVIIGNDLFVVEFPYYDGGSKQTISHFKRPKDLSTLGQVTGPYGFTFDGVLRPDRFINGYFTEIPDNWKILFDDANVIVGGEPANISGLASNGPDAFGWNSNEFADGQKVEPLLYYTQHNPLSRYNEKSELWNGTTVIAGVALLNNFRTFLVIQHQGIGEFCYGPGTDKNPAPIGYCYDPINKNMGCHAPPYVYRALAYDPVDFFLVPDGKVKHYEPRPYASWTFDLPFAVEGHHLNGLAYDYLGGRLFISQANGDGLKPVIHVFGIN